MCVSFPCVIPLIFIESFNVASSSLALASLHMIDLPHPYNCFHYELDCMLHHLILSCLWRFSVRFLALFWLNHGIHRWQWRSSASWWHGAHCLQKCKSLLAINKELWSTTCSPLRAPSSCGCMSIGIAPRQMLISPFNISTQTCYEIFPSVPIIWMYPRVSATKNNILT